MTRHAFRTLLLASIALPGFALAGAAHAQTAAAAETAADAEIIITASKRAATLQDTPISVSVTTRATIEQAQIRDLKDLQTLVPSLRVSQLQSSANTNFIIRGFGNGANNVGIEPSVGVFIDGVYRSRSAAQIGDLPNIDRIEVLRGPQSTLFGKNASAGIISIITQEPSFKWRGNAEVSYGNFNALVVKGDISGPINEQLAFSIGGNYNRRDGYGRDLAQNIDVNDRNRYGIRGSLLWTPTDTLKFRLIGDYDRIDENCCIVGNVVAGPTVPLINALGGRLDNNNPTSYRIFENFPSVNKIDNYGASLQADWEINPKLALTSISAYRAVKTNTNQDSDFTSADLIGSNFGQTKINTYTQELRLASSFEGPFNFLIGGFYFREDIQVNSGLTYGRDFRAYAQGLGGNIPAGGPLPAGPAYTLLERIGVVPVGSLGARGQGRTEDFRYNNEAISVFGQADFEFIEGLVFTAGGNYTDDRKSLASNNRTTDVFSQIDLAAIGNSVLRIPPAFANSNPPNALLGLRAFQFLPPFLNFPNAVESGRTHDTNFSYTLRLGYKFNSNLSGYVTHATGFKASSLNVSTDSRPPPSIFIPGPAISNPPPSAIRNAGLALVNLSTGSRSARPENASVYEAGLKGQWDGFAFNLAVFQQSLRDFQGNFFTGTGFVLTNAEKQSTTGVEFDTSLTPIRNINFTANVTYLNPKFDSFTNGVVLNPTTFASVPRDLTGTRPAGISEFTFSLATNISHDFSENLRGTLHVDYFNASPVLIAQGLPFKREDQSLNASFTLNVGQNIEATVWARNLANSQYITTVFAGVAQSGTLSGYPSQPRTFGGLLRYRF